MKFGYFTLSDNNYRNNDRSPNQCVSDILEQALYAEELGMHSVWIGEHHFSTLRDNFSPQVLLASIAAKTSRVRLVPSVSVLRLRNPVLVAEQWATLDLVSGGRVDFACRGYDLREYEPLGANFEDNAAIFAEGVEIVRRLWTERGPITHKGRHYAFENISVTPAPVQQLIPIYVASFSKPAIELAARLGLGLVVAAGHASTMHGSLAATAQVYRDGCAAVGRKPGRLITSYFIHFTDLKTTPASHRYLETIVQRFQTMKPENFTDMLFGSSAQIADTLKSKVETAGFDEVILYFNLGKPHARVKDEMARFMAEVAPKFAS